MMLCLEQSLSSAVSCEDFYTLNIYLIRMEFFVLLLEIHYITQGIEALYVHVISNFAFVSVKRSDFSSLYFVCCPGKIKNCFFFSHVLLGINSVHF